MEIEEFGQISSGETLYKYTLRNRAGSCLSVTNLGATMVAVQVPDRKNQLTNVILGYQTAGEYEKDGCFLGATIGRNANRIANASCTIGEKEYSLEQNDGKHNLHSGGEGFHRAVWKRVSPKDADSSITFSYVSLHREQGFPGNMKVEVTYELTDENEVRIAYRAVSDQLTIANITNHTYFNLGGEEGIENGIQDHILEIRAEKFTSVINEECIPTGDVVAVGGTPFDFRTPKEMGRDINEDDVQLQYGGGYDHNYMLLPMDETCDYVAKAYCPRTGIQLCMQTDYPGLQFYSGNSLSGTYGKRQGFCLEPQYFPNAINCPSFESPILQAGEPFEKHIILRFSAS